MRRETLTYVPTLERGNEKTLQLLTLAMLILSTLQNIAVSQTRTTYTLKTGSLIATTERSLNKALEIYGAGDIEAFNSFCNENFPNISITKKVITVYVTDTNQWNNTVKIRPVGKTSEYWCVYTQINGFNYER
ncbi:MAG: hypothetical protein KGJ59_09440 [Bacteroidota bacterium]|nr:hypothetical protein [Bacteroidota bacterium]